MKAIDLKQRRLGVNYTDDHIEISIWAPVAETLKVRFKNNKVVQLKKDAFGYWHGATEGKVSDEYYCILNSEEVPDITSLSQPHGVHGPSAVVDLKAFDWTDNNWNNLPLDEYMFYELHTGTFTENGTFDDILEKLDHIKGCGFTAIELMPVAQFPGDRNWGYDGVFPFAVQNSYGGPRALQRLVNKCHERGLAVVLDVVYNHMGPEGNYFSQFGPYFTDKYKTPWGEAINFDDSWCDGIRRYFIENALMWFRDFHIDALRLDAVHAIKDFSAKHILQEIREHVDELKALTGKQHYLIVECDLNDVRFINAPEKGGYGMDAQWSDEFHHALRVTAGQKKEGYYEDFDGIEHLAKAYTDAYVYDGTYSPHRLKTFGNKVLDNPGQQFVVFSQNHDQVGNRMLGERTSTLHSFEMQKLLAGAVLVSPYLPLFFMGEEWGTSNPFQYFISHTDPELVAAVRKGRKAEFASFHLKGEAPDPQGVETFNNCKLRWELMADEPHTTLLKYYTCLIDLRKSEPALRRLDRTKTTAVVHPGQNTLMLLRKHEARSIFCFLNFSKEKHFIPFEKTAELIRIFDSAEAEWRGPGSLTNSVAGIHVQPESIQLYSEKL